MWLMFSPKVRKTDDKKELATKYYQSTHERVPITRDYSYYFSFTILGTDLGRALHTGEHSLLSYIPSPLWGFCFEKGPHEVAQAD